MPTSNLLWLASYPRSGNTLLRTILWQCFDCVASAYPDDLGGNKALEDYVGHIEHDSSGRIFFPKNAPHPVTTHQYPGGRERAIYVIRDGRAVVISLWNFYHRVCSLDDIIEGRIGFGTWSAHMRAWDPLRRPGTLLLRYEDMLEDLPRVLICIHEFLRRPILSTRIPDRSLIAGSDGRWVRPEDSLREGLSPAQLERFMEINGETMAAYGYRALLPGRPDCFETDPMTHS